MQDYRKADRIELLKFSTPSMRAFHMAWMAFFLCFFAWFGIAPLMPIVRSEFGLSKDQVGWCIIGSVALTTLARLFVGWLCDRIGPRLTYTGLLILGSLPVMGIGLAHDFASFLIFRVLIGVIGAAFVVTQYHTTQMFADRCVGAANATTAGWGNFGGGVTHVVMPLVFAFFVSTLGLTPGAGWRASMVIAGAVCLAMGVAYYILTQDTPRGNVRDLRAAGIAMRPSARNTFLLACRDPRVWALFAAYGLCFGVELTIDNVAALYFVDYFPELESMGSVRAERGGIVRQRIRRDERFCPDTRRLHSRPMRQQMGIFRPRQMAVHRPILRRAAAHAVLTDAWAVHGDTIVDALRPIRAYGGRSHFCRRSFHQSLGVGLGRRNRRGRRQRGSRALGPAVQKRYAVLAGSLFPAGVRSHAGFLCELVHDASRPRRVPGLSGRNLGCRTPSRCQFGRCGRLRIDLP